MGQKYRGITWSLEISKRNVKMELDLKCAIIRWYFDLLWLVHGESSSSESLAAPWPRERCSFWVGVCSFSCLRPIFVNIFGKNGNIEPGF